MKKFLWILLPIATIIGALVLVFGGTDLGTDVVKVLCGILIVFYIIMGLLGSNNGT